MPQEDGCPSVSLYVLYLMSVHEEPSFVTACFDFLMFRPFRFRSEDIFPIFVNFGAEVRDLCILDEETLLRKFFRTDGNIDKISKRPKFPHCNLEAVNFIYLF